MVAHAKTVYHLALRIILLRIYLVITIGREKRLHVVILRLMGHEEHVVIAQAFQHGGQSPTARRHRAFHEVAKHQCREAVQRCRQAVVGVYSGTVEIGERERVLVKRVERRRERLALPELAKQRARHRLHQYDHDIGLDGGFLSRRIVDDKSPKHTAAVGRAPNAKPGARVGHGLRRGHEPQFLVLRLNVVEH